MQGDACLGLEALLGSNRGAAVLGRGHARALLQGWPTKLQPPTDDGNVCVLAFFFFFEEDFLTEFYC